MPECHNGVKMSIRFSFGGGSAGNGFAQFVQRPHQHRGAVELLAQFPDSGDNFLGGHFSSALRVRITAGASDAAAAPTLDATLRFILGGVSGPVMGGLPDLNIFD